jgi:hypothetical protein
MIAVIIGQYDPHARPAARTRNCHPAKNGRVSADPPGAPATPSEVLSDYIAEIRFGLIFAGLRYEFEFEPLGEKGPDLLVSRRRRHAHR